MQSLQHPVLLPELLFAIFSCVLDGLRDGKARVQFALNVSQVSRDWRATALGHSALWATIVIDDVQRGVRNLVALFLSRARSHLLDVIVYADDLAHPDGAYMALKEAVGVRERWRSLRGGGMVGQNQLHRFIAMVNVYALPQLQALNLTGVGPDRSNLRWAALRRAAGTLPGLRTLRVADVRLVLNDLSPAPLGTLRSLTALEIGGRTTGAGRNAPRLRDIIEATPSLERLTLGNFVPLLFLHGPAAALEPVLLPCLRFLQVSLLGAWNAHMFTELAAPALESLELRPCDSEAWTRFTAIVAGSGPKFPALRTLHVGNMPSMVPSPPVAAWATPGFFPEDHGIAASFGGGGGEPTALVHTGFYAATPAVTTLSLDGVGEPLVLEGVLAASAPGGDACVGCWPELQEVRIGGADVARQMHGQLIATLVKARKDVGCPLSTIGIQDTWVKAIDSGWLRRLAETLRVRFFAQQNPRVLAEADW